MTLDQCADEILRAIMAANEVNLKEEVAKVALMYASKQYLRGYEDGFFTGLQAGASEEFELLSSEESTLN
jgi:hypothetical protein